VEKLPEPAASTDTLRNFDVGKNRIEKAILKYVPKSSKIKLNSEGK
jgi:hypothetical protein